MQDIPESAIIQVQRRITSMQFAPDGKVYFWGNVIIKSGGMSVNTSVLFNIVQDHLNSFE